MTLPPLSIKQIIFYSFVAFILFLAYKKRQDGVVIFGKDMYIQLIRKQYNIVLLTGKGWGSYKTYTAVLTARMLMNTGQYKRCYANFPVIFADSPPRGIAPPFMPKEEIKKKGLKEFDFLANYSRDSIFIFDEVWLKFSTYNPKMVNEVFAFPRKMNQLYLMTSVLEVGNFSAFTRGVVTKKANYQPLGIPLLWMNLKSMEDYKKKPKTRKNSFYSSDDSTSIFIFFPFLGFKLYNTNFQPSSIEPINQYKDRGVLYDTQSREISILFHKLFDLNQFNEAVPKNKLTEGQKLILNQFFPVDKFYFDKEIKEFPNIIKKTKNPLISFFGTEINPFMALQFGLFIYGLIITLYFFANMALMTGDIQSGKISGYPNPFSSSDNIIKFLKMEDPQYWDYKENNSKNTKTPYNESNDLEIIKWSENEQN